MLSGRYAKGEACGLPLLSHEGLIYKQEAIKIPSFDRGNRDVMLFIVRRSVERHLVRVSCPSIVSAFGSTESSDGVFVLFSVWRGGRGVLVGFGKREQRSTGRRELRPRSEGERRQLSALL